jgi:hypothetical protein
MTFYLHVNGDVIDADETNADNAECLSLGLTNYMESLIDRAITQGKGLQEPFGEAYIDATGRNNTVDTGDTTALFFTNKYICGENTGTLHDPDSCTNPTYFFDGNLTTYATKTTTDNYPDINLGKTFSAQTIKSIYINVGLTGSASSGGAGNSGTITNTITLESYNGATWDSEGVLDTNTVTDSWVSDGSISLPLTYTGCVNLNKSVQGIRLSLNISNTFAHEPGMGQARSNAFYFTEMFFLVDELEIHHDIPTGTISPTVSKVIGKAKVADWETGADIKYKLTNAGEDSGWLDCGITPEISSFTAFTSEPTKLIVQLIPKSSSPTAGYPSIYAFSVRGV